MNKFNYKYFKNIKSSPMVVQQTDKGVVEIHSLNESIYYDEYISKGRFFFWSSDGNVVRLVIEEGYFEELRGFFVDKVNAQWIKYYDSTEQIRSRYMKRYLFPGMIGYSVVSFVTIMVFPKASMYILVAILLIVILLSKTFSNKLNDQFNLRHNEAIANIKKIVGKREYKELLDKQEKYRNKFYKFDDLEETENEEIVNEAFNDEEENKEV
jgi:hypothetical protein